MSAVHHNKSCDLLQRIKRQGLNRYFPFKHFISLINLELNGIVSVIQFMTIPLQDIAITWAFVIFKFENFHFILQFLSSNYLNCYKFRAL